VTNGRVARCEISLRDASSYGRLHRGFGRSKGRADAIFIEPGHGGVAYHYQAIGIKSLGW
jgi:hypothetical protein